MLALVIRSIRLQGRSYLVREIERGVPGGPTVLTHIVEHAGGARVGFRDAPQSLSTLSDEELADWVASIIAPTTDRAPQ